MRASLAGVPAAALDTASRASVAVASVPPCSSSSLASARGDSSASLAPASRPRFSLAQLDPGMLRDPLVVRAVFVLVVVVVAIVVGYGVARFNRGLLRGLGVDEAVEGTAFERTANRFDSSTVSILAGLSGVFVFAMVSVVALSVANVAVVLGFWNAVLGFLPRLFVALVIAVVGFVVGDKVELLVDERLRGVKLPEVSALPTLAKWSVFYVAALIVLAQINVTTGALVVLLGAYAFAVVVVPAVAFRDLLSSGGAGLYLLLTEPYAIGDRVRIGDVEGVVQEMDLFTTRIETGDAECTVPNRRVLVDGVVRLHE